MPSLRPRRSLFQQRDDSDTENTNAPPRDSSDGDSSSSDEREQSDWETPRKRPNKKITSSPTKKKARKSTSKSQLQASPEPKRMMEELDEETLNAPPITTSDEESASSDGEQSDGLGLDFESTPRRPRNDEQKETLEQKLKSSTPKQKKDFSKSPSSARKRTSQEMQESGDPRDMLFGMWSQRSYGNKRHSYSKFRKTPSSSFAESHPPSSAPVPKSSVTSFEDKGESSEEEKEGKKEFRFPCNIDTSPRDEIPDSDDDLSSPLSSALSYGSAEDVPMKDEDEDETKEDPAEYLCPICKEPVDPGSLILFRAQARQRIKDQLRFCASHKSSVVEQQWQEKGYPTIDWNIFDERIESHFNELEKFLVPESTSYYRNVLDTAMKSGKAKNFRLTLAGDALETISCGYYGTRGSGMMLQSLTTHFARKLRRLATQDSIVKQAGVVPYAQAVLVPELAIRLIKEDMNVDDDAARQIMRESIELGQKVNPAENDVVPVQEEKDGQGEGEEILN
ncbi:RTC4 family protein [Aspergillus stella-maris]|uniref:RTC4 family protein n=1 Tax=Aspergillus stella-maris TaxID=1810926 RepID=UPI003CCE392C